MLCQQNHFYSVTINSISANSLSVISSNLATTRFDNSTISSSSKYLIAFLISIFVLQSVRIFFYIFQHCFLYILYFQALISFLEAYMLYGSFFLSTSAFWNSSFLTINHLFKNSIVVIHVLQS